MTVEERLESAIADLEGLLAEGASVEAAVDAVAKDYKFSPLAIRERATKALGCLDQVALRVARQVKSAQDQAALKAAIHEFARTDTDETAKAWLQEKIGREPTEEEAWSAVEASMSVWLARNMNNFRKD